MSIRKALCGFESSKTYYNDKFADTMHDLVWFKSKADPDAWMLNWKPIMNIFIFLKQDTN